MRLSATTSLRTFCMALAMLAAAIVPMAAQAQQAGTSLSITLTGDSGEVIGAWRRAHGMDPPDPNADRRFAEVVARVRGAHGQGATPQRAILTMNRLAAATPPVPQLRALAVSRRP